MGPENRTTYTGHFNLLIPTSVTTEILMIPPDQCLWLCVVILLTHDRTINISYTYQQSLVIRNSSARRDNGYRRIKWFNENV